MHVYLKFLCLLWTFSNPNFKLLSFKSLQFLDLNFQFLDFKVFSVYLWLGLSDICKLVLGPTGKLRHLKLILKYIAIQTVKHKTSKSK